MFVVHNFSIYALFEKMEWNLLTCFRFKVRNVITVQVTQRQLGRFTWFYNFHISQKQFIKQTKKLCKDWYSTICKTKTKTSNIPLIKLRLIQISSSLFLGFQLWAQFIFNWSHLSSVSPLSFKSPEDHFNSLIVLSVLILTWLCRDLLHQQQQD